MQRKKLNKRADATDVFIVTVIVFFLAISFIIGIFVNTKLVSVIQDTALNETNVSTTIISQFEKVNSTGIQRGFMMIFAILLIFTMVSAFLVRVHPAFIFIYIITLLVTVFSSFFMANVYGALVDNPVLAATIASQPIITFFMKNLPIVATGVGLLSMIVVFAKLFIAPTGGDSIGGF